MPACVLHSIHALFALALLYSSSAISAQQPEPRTDTDQPEKTTLASGIDRIFGLEPTSNIHYVRLILSGSLHTPSTADSPAPSPYVDRPMHSEAQRQILVRALRKLRGRYRPRLLPSMDTSLK